jgi:hypothetical protein
MHVSSNILNAGHSHLMVNSYLMMNSHLMVNSYLMMKSHLMVNSHLIVNSHVVGNARDGCSTEALYTLAIDLKLAAQSTM